MYLWSLVNGVVRYFLIALLLMSSVLNDYVHCYQPVS